MSQRLTTFTHTSHAFPYGQLIRFEKLYDSETILSEEKLSLGSLRVCGSWKQGMFAEWETERKSVKADEKSPANKLQLSARNSTEAVLVFFRLTFEQIMN